MAIKKNIDNATDTRSKNEQLRAIDKKFDELMILLSNSDISPEKANKYQERFSNVMSNTINGSEESAKEEFSILLSNTTKNNKLLKLYMRGESISKFVLIALSLVMIILGFGMIIMPAPPFFEMYTIFYFNHDDGITVMDLISLIIVLAGVYFLIKGVYKNPALKRLTRNNHSTNTKKI